MAHQDHLQTVARLYKLFVEGDLTAILKLVSDNVDWEFFGSGRIPWAGPRRGHAGVEQFFRSVGETTTVEIFEPEEFITAAESVVVLGHERKRMRTNGLLAS